jgi:hypothetical protein
VNDYLGDSRGGNIKLLRIGEVRNNADPSGVGALKVRLEGGTDKNDSDTNLIDCLPLMPRYLNVIPDVGEKVFIIQLEYKKGPEITQKSERFWIGPIISQFQNLEKEDSPTAKAGFLSGWIKPKKPVDEIPESEGAYPKKDEIAIQGRYSGDLIFKKNYNVLRIGKFKNDNRLKFNNSNVGYIQLKYGDDDLKKEFVNETVDSFKYIPPEIRTIVSIKSRLSNGVILPDGLTDDEYSNATEHQLDMTKIDIEKNSIINFDSDTFTTRSEALDAAIDALEAGSTFNGVFGLSGKWELSSKIIEILEKYGQGSQKSFKNYKVIYPNSTQKVQETKKVLKLSKNTSGVKSTIVNVVADKINLISHDGNHTFDLTDRKELINKETQNKIHSTPENGGAQSIVYGEKLVEFLELVRDYVKLHVHPYHGMPADEGIQKLSVLEFDLESILNTNIKTN